MPRLETGANCFRTPVSGWAAHARGRSWLRAEGNMRHSRRSEALREYRTQQCRFETAEVYEWMAMAHRRARASTDR